ncbi:MAG TPA: hypothetical protein PKC37_10120 [Kaistella sp.]|nr:hypothetical protein [Flavobacteriales bacterium]MCA0391612.1 hypothetical protein [Bacteroidota bacterium]HMU08256.1 hypothetical protein [Kaistella sp.]MBN8622853.1 hypothetical protein [Flavobacteriales bacterium]HOB25217.1 hypothetical protein [Kaistella sp.]
MKKLLTYFLLSLYLLSFTEARQVLKLPNLIEHYISHELRDKNTTLYSFIKMHYLDAPVKDSDYNQDMSLPFKTHDLSPISINLVVPPKKIEFSFEQKKLFVEKKQNFAYSETFYPSVFQKIWQPPKI